MESPATPAQTVTSSVPSERRIPELSVIVVVYNHGPELQRCLEALQNCIGDKELIVVDDHSQEDIRSIVERFNAQYFLQPRREGPASARNLGAQLATGNILIFVDADVAVNSDVIGIIKEEFENDPELAALFGSYDDEPACLDFWSSFKNLLHHYVHQTSSPDAVTFWAGCGAIRRQAFAGAGGFDADRYRTASIEDIDLGIRMTQRQCKIRLVKRLQAKHLKKWTMGSMIRTDIFRRAIPWTQLILRTKTIPRDLNLTAESRASAMLIASASLLAVWIGTNFMLRSGERTLTGALLLSLVALMSLNHKLYGFFRRKRGAGFAIRAIAAHWLYLFYSGSVFIFCSALARFRNSDPSESRTAVHERILSKRQVDAAEVGAGSTCSVASFREAEDTVDGLAGTANYRF
jgi:glycosyltransferase involved in cell wall biosynthesis